MSESFRRDVREGLSLVHKRIPSKYFYDAHGSSLFQRIMHLPEYYLTRAELEIFKTRGNEIVEGLGIPENRPFEIIELGAGDGLKTIELLSVMSDLHSSFDYIPIDISRDALDGLSQTLHKELPEISVRPRQGDYFDVLHDLKEDHKFKIILFLGSNIGNLLDDVSKKFIYNIGSNLSPGHKLLLGVDLIKSADIILPAYNDEQGVTRRFNLNLLRRINRDLGGNFELDNFGHQVTYDENEGIVRSYIVSQQAQDVYIDALSEHFTFEEGERIHTEISRKYDDGIMDNLLGDSDFVVKHKFTDRDELFADYILERQ